MNRRKKEGIFLTSIAIHPFFLFQEFTSHFLCRQITKPDSLLERIVWVIYFYCFVDLIPSKKEVRISSPTFLPSFLVPFALLSSLSSLSFCSSSLSRPFLPSVPFFPLTSLFSFFFQFSLFIALSIFIFHFTVRSFFSLLLVLIYLSQVIVRVFRSKFYLLWVSNNHNHTIIAVAALHFSCWRSTSRILLCIQDDKCSKAFFFKIKSICKILRTTHRSLMVLPSANKLISFMY